MRLRTRFALAGTICTSIIAIGAGGVLLKNTTTDLNRSYDRQLSARLDAVDPVVATSPSLDRLVEVLSANAQGVGIRVIRPDKSEVRVGTVPATPPLFTGSGPLTIKAGAQNYRAVQDSVNSSEISDVSGSITVQVYGPLQDLHNRTRHLRNEVIWTSVISVGLAGLLSWIVGGYAARPLRRLEQSIGNDHVPDTQGVAEVDSLGRTLNQEHERTRAALQTAQEFSWNAVHELRTPLMSIRSDLDVAQVSLSDQPEMLALVNDMIRQHERTSALLTALHDLARTDLQSEDKFTAVDLAEIADAAIDVARARYPGIEIVLSCPDHVWINGWEEGLRLMIDNLLRNAVQHGSKHSSTPKVLLSLAVFDGQSEMRVEDNGTGVPLDQRAAIFERFKRGSTDSNGLGLGLALVREQALLHQGTVTVTDSELGGAAFVVTLPVLG